MGANTCRELVCFQLADELQRRIVEITAMPPADFARFLAIARGSLAETQVHLRAGLERRYFEENSVVELLVLAARCDRVTSALRAYLLRCKNPVRRTSRRTYVERSG